MTDDTMIIQVFDHNHQYKLALEYPVDTVAQIYAGTLDILTTKPRDDLEDRLDAPRQEALIMAELICRLINAQDGVTDEEEIARLILSVTIPIATDYREEVAKGNLLQIRVPNDPNEYLEYQWASND